MHGFVKRNAINSFALGDQSIISLKTEAEFNNIPATNCNSNLSYDPKVDGFVFGIPLGECGMETEQKNIDEEMHITFTSRNGENFNLSFFLIYFFLIIFLFFWFKFLNYFSILFI